MLNKNEVKYTISIIMKIAFPDYLFEFKNYNEIIFNGYNIHFNLMNKEEQSKLINGKLSYYLIKNVTDEFDIPIFLCKQFLTKENKNIIINPDIITLPFLLLSRKEEQLINNFDSHGRFLFKGSLSDIYNIIDFPIVDEYAFLLRKELNRYLNIPINTKKTNLYLTHDVDNLFRFYSPLKSFKSIFGGDLILRKNFKIFIKSLHDYVSFKKDKMNDPGIKALYKLMNVSKMYNYKSHFFFLCYNIGDDDFRYNIFDSRVKKIITELINNNMIIGLHAGKNAGCNNENFTKQLSNLKNYVKNIKENRNHYLMYNSIETVNILETNNIKMDYTLGYRERIGFKCGTSYDYPLYNFTKDKISKVIERPLIVMDVTLKENMKLNYKESVEKVIKLYKRVKNVNGNFTILWHPDSVVREWEPWFNNVYLKILEEISNENSYNS